VRKTILLALAGLVVFAGCKDQGKDAGIPIAKWKGAPYHLAFDTQAAKPGTVLPAIKFTANPEMLEKRAVLVVRYDDSVVKKSDQPVDQIILPPFDIAGADGTLPADMIDSANKDLTRLLGAYCVKGKVPVKVRLTRSSISSTAGASEIESKALSDWTPIEINFKNTKPGC
jgi:hypothetical protein